MDSILIRGGRKLTGEVRISAPKNAALPILASGILASGRSTFKKCSASRRHFDDAQTARLARAKVEGDRTTQVDADGIKNFEAPYDLVKTMRASVLVLGPLLARFGCARVSLPGGCAIGARPIDQHLKGLEAMGAKIKLNHGYVDAKSQAPARCSHRLRHRNRHRD